MVVEPKVASQLRGGGGVKLACGVPWIIHSISASFLIDFIACRDSKFIGASMATKLS